MSMREQAEAAGLSTLHENWLPSLIFSPCPGGDKREGAGCENSLFNSLLDGNWRANLAS